MISTTKQTKVTKTLKKALKTLLAAAFWILVWEAASRIVSLSNELLLLILPSPFTVLKKWLEIGFTASFLSAVGITLLRILLGFVSGVVIGFILGVLTHYLEVLNTLFSPLLKIIRAVPVVAIIILLYLFFDSATLPIIIVALMVLPIIWQTTHDGLNNTDSRLLEMAKVFKVKPLKTLFFIKLPQLTPSLLSSSVNALGLAWKSGVAAEVICLPDLSLGTLLWLGKGNVNYDEVYAITLTVVILSLIIEFLLKTVYNKTMKGGVADDRA